MKRTISFRQMLVAALFISISVFAKLYATDYTVSFKASGKASSISSVEVYNLTQNTNIIVSGGAPVVLTNTTAIPLLESGNNTLKIYPNPVTDKAIISFYSEFGGNTDILVFGIDGKSIVRLSKNLSFGTNQFKLSLPKGIYTIHINENGILHYATIISQTNNKAAIEFSGNDMTEIKPMQKASKSSTSFSYKEGDNLLLKGYSGDLCTIVPLKPTKDTIINFYFVECRDADGYNYPVVRIGNQTWMAENLKTTKYRNGDAIGTTSPATKDISSETAPKYQWTYNGDENNAAKYGRLYSWYAVADSRSIAPARWHVPTDAEWTTLQNYQIANGYNFDGSITSNKIAKSLAASTDWEPYTTIGTIGNDLTKNNRSGFTALSGGYRLDYGQFKFVGNFGLWWSSTENSTQYAYCRVLYYYDYGLNRYGGDTKSYGYSIRCVLDDAKPPQYMWKINVNNVTTTSAVCEGEVLDDGGSPITEKGICWSIGGVPTINDYKVIDGAGTGKIKCVLSNLTPGSMYSVRAYATNSIGTSYGDHTYFVTYDGTVTDIDGNIYFTKKIGNQTWMAENLKTTHYQNGDAIDYITDNTTWSEHKTGAWCNYDNLEDNGVKYGHLYNWYTVNDSRKIAPAGYHIPTESEWIDLENYLISTHSPNTDKIAKDMASKTDWYTDVNDTIAGSIGKYQYSNNLSGFSALPAGYRRGDISTFDEIGKDADVWSSTEISTGLAFDRTMNYNLPYLYSGNYMKTCGFSIRCIKDGAIAVNTSVASEITDKSINCGGEIFASNEFPVTARGVCWSTTRDPTINDNKTIDGSGTGKFTSSISGLTLGIIYYARAYATSSNGTVYGNEISFSTVNLYDGYYSVSGTLTDSINSKLTGIYPNYVNLISQDQNSVAYNDAESGIFRHTVLDYTTNITYYYGDFAPVFKFDSNNNVISVTNYYGQEAGTSKRSAQLDPLGINKYDPENKTLKVKYWMIQNGMKRCSFDETFTFISVR